MKLVLLMSQQGQLVFLTSEHPLDALAFETFEVELSDDVGAMAELAAFERWGWRATCRGYYFDDRDTIVAWVDFDSDRPSPLRPELVRFFPSAVLERLASERDATAVRRLCQSP